MKTIEEKAKAYDEAIRKLRGMMPNWERLSYNGKTFLQDLIYIFPELAESEDEKVRKTLIDFFSKGAKLNGTTNGVADKDILAWLEKQKGNIGGISPNSAWSEEDEQHVNSLLKRLQGMCKKGATYIATRFPVSQDIDWLKSIKERKGGKI